MIRNSRHSLGVLLVLSSLAACDAPSLHPFFLAQQRPMILAHRGGGGIEPEATVPTMVGTYMRNPAAVIEFDVHKSRDGQIVVMHDATVDRTTDGHGRLSSLTLSQVQSLDAGSWFDAEYAGTPVPTFAEFLDVLAASGHRAIVEFKGEWDAAAVAVAVAEVTSRNLERRIAVSSFDARTLGMAGAASSVLPRLFILRHLPPDVVRAATEAGVRGLIVDRRAVLERPEVVDAVSYTHLTLPTNREV